MELSEDGKMALRGQGREFREFFLRMKPMVESWERSDMIKFICF